MFREELSDAEISILRERIALTADHPQLTHHEAEAIASVQVRLRRYGASLFLSEGERHRLYLSIKPDAYPSHLPHVAGDAAIFFATEGGGAQSG
jgi:hypothetical protein